MATTIPSITRKNEMVPVVYLQGLAKDDQNMAEGVNKVSDFQGIIATRRYNRKM